MIGKIGRMGGPVDIAEDSLGIHQKGAGQLANIPGRPTDSPPQKGFQGGEPDRRPGQFPQPALAQPIGLVGLLLRVEKHFRAFWPVK